MVVDGKIEFRDVGKLEPGMLVVYKGEFNGDNLSPYEIKTVGESKHFGRTFQTACLENDKLDVAELFFIDSSHLQEIVCTFDVPTDDIDLRSSGIYRSYKIEYIRFKSLEELSYIINNDLKEVSVEYKNGEIEIMGKTHITSENTIKTGGITMNDRFQEIFNMLGISSAPSNTVNDLKVITEQLKCVGYIPYPVSLSTVDIVPYYVNTKGNIFLLMGRKPGQEKFQFVGGFRDPAETNEFAAARELNEEASIKLDEHRFKPHGTFWINDRRYRESVHKITTALYTVEITYEEMQLAKGADDMEEIRSFLLSDLISNHKEDIRDVHHELFDRVVSIFSKN